MLPSTVPVGPVPPGLPPPWPPRRGGPLGTTKEVLGFLIGFPMISLILLGFPMIILGFLRISYDSLIVLIRFPRISIVFSVWALLGRERTGGATAAGPTCGDSGGRPF